MISSLPPLLARLDVDRRDDGNDWRPQLPTELHMQNAQLKTVMGRGSVAVRFTSCINLGSKTPDGRPSTGVCVLVIHRLSGPRVGRTGNIHYRRSGPGSVGSGGESRQWTRFSISMTYVHMRPERFGGGPQMGTDEILLWFIDSERLWSRLLFGMLLTMHSAYFCSSGWNLICRLTSDSIVAEICLPVENRLTQYVRYLSPMIRLLNAAPKRNVAYRSRERVFSSWLRAIMVAHSLLVQFGDPPAYSVPRQTLAGGSPLRSVVFDQSKLGHTPHTRSTLNTQRIIMPCRRRAVIS